MLTKNISILVFVLFSISCSQIKNSILLFEESEVPQSIKDEFPNSKYPYAKKEDGCSSWTNDPKLVRDKWGRADFTPTCNQHDRCYYTANETMNNCNRNFLKSLNSTCWNDLRFRVKGFSLFGEQVTSDFYLPPNPIELAACYVVANSFYVAVQISPEVFISAQEMQKRYLNKINDWQKRPEKYDPIYESAYAYVHHIFPSESSDIRNRLLNLKENLDKLIIPISIHRDTLENIVEFLRSEKVSPENIQNLWSKTVDASKEICRIESSLTPEVRLALTTYRELDILRKRFDDNIDILAQFSNDRQTLEKPLEDLLAEFKWFPSYLESINQGNSSYCHTSQQLISALVKKAEVGRISDVKNNLNDISDQLLILTKNDQKLILLSKTRNIALDLAMNFANSLANARNLRRLVLGDQLYSTRHSTITEIESKIRGQSVAEDDVLKILKQSEQIVMSEADSWKSLTDQYNSFEIVRSHRRYVQGELNKIKNLLKTNFSEEEKSHRINYWFGLITRYQETIPIRCSSKSNAFSDECWSLPEVPQEEAKLRSFDTNLDLFLEKSKSVVSRINVEESNEK